MKRLFIGCCIFFTAFYSCFADLLEVGFLNGLNQPAELIVEYTSGRKIDRHLNVHEAVVTGRQPGEELLRVRINAPGRPAEIVPGSMIRRLAPHRGGPWLFIAGKRSRVISSKERVQIMSAW
jgi:hypothetical protein